VSYKEHDEVAPTLSGSEVTSSANAASVSASDSLVNLASGVILDPTAAVGFKEDAHRLDGLGAIKAFDY
jgi:hypothetical protein